MLGKLRQSLPGGFAGRAEGSTKGRMGQLWEEGAAGRRDFLLSDLDVAARRVPQLLRKAANDPRAEKAAPLYEAVPSFFSPYPLLSSRTEEVRKDRP